MELAVVLVIAAAAVTAVMLPLLRGSHSAHDPELDAVGTPAGSPTVERAAVEARVREYRAALTDGTVCHRCGRANPGGSRYCAECGRRLPSARRRKRAEPGARAR